ncbi:MAG: serine/threonine-protein phosphatase, partial [Actinomycetota bacterium]|nr:serine/threonine-protein phosphatase [Actinomycetota bacterium]
EALASAVGGMVDIDHTLTVVHHWGALPPDTVVIEIEPADTSLGLGFSEEIGATIEPVLAMLREELGACGIAADLTVDEDELAGPFGVEPASPGPPPSPVVDATPPSAPLVELVNYGRFHQRVSRTIEGLRRGLGVDHLPQVEGLSLAARLRPSGGLGLGGDWYDVMPLDAGWVGVAMGDVVGSGIDAAPVMSQLRAAIWAYALLDGTSPARVMAHLDALVHAMELGEMTTVLYLAVHPSSGQVRLTSAGHCPPLIVKLSGGTEFFEAGRSVPLGTAEGADRPEAEFSLSPGSTLLAFTDGLVERRGQAITDGLAQLRRAAANGPSGLESLCDHVLSVCTTGAPQGDDVALVAIRREERPSG